MGSIGSITKPSIGLRVPITGYSPFAVVIITESSGSVRWSVIRALV